MLCSWCGAICIMVVFHSGCHRNPKVIINFKNAKSILVFLQIGVHKFIKNTKTENVCLVWAFYLISTAKSSSHGGWTSGIFISPWVLCCWIIIQLLNMMSIMPPKTQKCTRSTVRYWGSDSPWGAACVLANISDTAGLHGEPRLLCWGRCCNVHI